MVLILHPKTVDTKTSWRFPGSAKRLCVQFDDAEPVFRTGVLSRVSKRMSDITYAIDRYRSVASMFVTMHHQFDSIRVARDHLRQIDAVFSYARIPFKQT